MFEGVGSFLGLEIHYLELAPYQIQCTHVRLWVGGERTVGAVKRIVVRNGSPV